jgi:DNA repair protein RadC
MLQCRDREIPSADRIHQLIGRAKDDHVVGILPSKAGMEQFSALKRLPEPERPREKLKSKGLAALSDGELLGLIIATGNSKTSAVGLAWQMLKQVNGIYGLGQCDLQDLMNHEGIGLAKATTIMAAFELGRRMQEAGNSRDYFCSPAQLADHFRPRLAYKPVEVFRVMLLNQANFLIGEEDMFTGGVSHCAVDARIVFRYALQMRASKIVLCHNHPSGNLNPSRQDYTLTAEFLKMASILGIKLLDHIIVSSCGYFSFCDYGLFDLLQEDSPNYHVIESRVKSKMLAAKMTYAEGNGENRLN